MRLSPFTTRLAAIAVLFLLPWLAWSLAASPMLEGLSQDRLAIAQSWLFLARYRDLAEAVPLLERQRDALRDAGALRLFQTEATPSMRAAAMQSAVQRFIASAGVLLHSSRTLAVTNEGGHERTGLDLDLAATMSALTRLLHAFAVAEPAILVDKLTIRVPENGAAALGSDGQIQVSVLLRLASFSRPSPAAAR